MEMASKQIVPAPRDRVWAALNDPQVLKACITGCESIEALRTRSQFVEITTAGIRESHVHDVQIVKEAPNYRVE